MEYQQRHCRQIFDYSYIFVRKNCKTENMCSNPPTHESLFFVNPSSILHLSLTRSLFSALNRFSSRFSPRQETRERWEKEAERDGEPMIHLVRSTLEQMMRLLLS